VKRISVVGSSLPLAVLLTATASGAPGVRPISYDDARPILESLRADLVPADWRVVQASRRASQWPPWLAQLDRAIRARVARGERDSVANLIIFGSSFTSQPRASGDDLAALTEQPSRVSARLQARLDDFVRAVATPAGNERLQMARTVLEASNIDPSTTMGRTRARAYLIDALTEAQRDAARAPRASSEGTAFRTRGLSSDTSMLVNAALDRALATMRAQRLFPSRVRRVAIVGPGLDITDKHDGHDFYPVQTVQPFAVIDMLVQHGLSALDDVRVTTLDLSPRVLSHIDAARRQAEAGRGYVLNLPRTVGLPWGTELARYWEGFGTRIGSSVAGVKVPPGAGPVTVRSVRVRPAVVGAIEAQNVNIVTERLDVSPTAPFDLVVATDVLVYYDVFEQSLALANIAAMLGPGGHFLTNTPFFELPAIALEWGGSIDVLHMTLPIAGDIRDRVSWHRRR